MTSQWAMDVAAQKNQQLTQKSLPEKVIQRHKKKKYNGDSLLRQFDMHFYFVKKRIVLSERTLSNYNQRMII